MPQSLTQMPKEASFVIRGWPIRIRDHEVVSDDGLFGEIMHMVKRPNTDRRVLARLEEHKINYETAIEYCARELENNTVILANIINWYYNMGDIEKASWQYNRNIILDFSKMDAGRAIASQFIEKIRSCENWQELYDEMHLTSKFSKDMKKKIIREIKQCRKV